MVSSSSESSRESSHDASTALPQFVELMALVYHEGRNVSRIFHLNAASTRTFGKLAELPPDDSKAWEMLIPSQQRASEKDSAKDAEAQFRDVVTRTVADLGGFVLFDPGTHYQVELPGSWPAVVDASSLLK